jgi:hypothetical protein
LSLTQKLGKKGRFAKVSKDRYFVGSKRALAKRSITSIICDKVTTYECCSDEEVVL